jgi:hypothetical protein
MSFLTEHSSRIGAEEFRRLQDEGKTSRPAPTLRTPQASYIQIPSQESGRGIKCRVVLPPSFMPDGVFLYIHSPPRNKARILISGCSVRIWIIRLVSLTQLQQLGDTSHHEDGERQAFRGSVSRGSNHGRTSRSCHTPPIYHRIFRYPGSQLATLEDLKAEAEKQKPKLLPALFPCGTLDPFIDDTVMMSLSGRLLVVKRW